MKKKKPTKKKPVKKVNISRAGVSQSLSSNKALANKAKQSGISLSKLKAVYKRGLAAWKQGHRPGVTPSQWAMGRVNSFITGKGGARKADADLLKKKKKKKKK